MTNRKLTLSGTLALVGLALAACGGDQGDAEPIEFTSEGHALYATQCAMCHGDAGLGDGPMAVGLPVEPPSLMEHLAHHRQDQLIQIILNGVPPAMPPAAMTEAQVQMVIDYTWTLVPDSMVAELREMQRMVESGEMPAMDAGSESDGMDHSMHMPGMAGDSGMSMPDSSGR